MVRCTVDIVADDDADFFFVFLLLVLAEDFAFRLADDDDDGTLTTGFAMDSSFVQLLDAVPASGDAKYRDVFLCETGWVDHLGECRREENVDIVAAAVAAEVEVVVAIVLIAASGCTRNK